MLNTSGILSSGGYIKRFESMFGGAVGTKYRVSTTSVTTDLYLVFYVLSIGKINEVIILNFVTNTSGSDLLFDPRSDGYL